MKQLRDRVVVVTGAASGIGQALASVLARRGCDLALVDVDSSGLEKTAGLVREAGRKASVHVADVADRERMARLPEDVLAVHGSVHVLINNAGVNAEGTLADVPLEDFEWVVGVNFWGTVYGCRFFLPHLKAVDEAHIVNLSSLFGIVGMPDAGPYCATKFAVRGLSESLWAELADTNVGVTCVHPGGVKTNITRNQRLQDEAAREELAQNFDRVARMSPERAAERIVRAIEKNRFRQRVTAETYVTDWLKRLMPVATHRLIARLARQESRYGRVR